MAAAFHVEIVTPERVLLSGEAGEVSMRTDGGEIAFLAHHEDFVGAAQVTVVRVDPEAGGDGEGGEVERYAVHGGFVQFDQRANVLTILAGVAERSSEIDVARARRALEVAESTEGAGTPPAAPPGAPSRAEAPGDDGLASRPAGSAVTPGAPSAPDAPEAAAMRARTRLDAAGATSPS